MEAAFVANHRSMRTSQSRTTVFLLGEVQQFRAGACADTENPRIGRQIGEYQADKQSERVAQRGQFRVLFVVGRRAFFVKDNGWFLIWHGRLSLTRPAA